MTGALLVAVGGCDRRAPRPPHVLLIVIDTLRADRVGAFGGTRGLTPFLDELAARGTVFTRAYASSSWTPPSVTSLLTSRFPSQHRVNTAQSMVSDVEVTLAEALRAARYVTLGFSANLRLLPELGFAQGFDVWRVYQKGLVVKQRGSELREAALPLIDERCGPDARPCLVYLQYMEPHAPYTPAEPFVSRFGQQPPDGVDVHSANMKLLAYPMGQLAQAEIRLLASYYDAEVATVDAELRRLFAELARRRFLDQAVVVITADHGEEFMEHGALSHGSALYEETVRVPLIVLGPGVPAGRRVDHCVSLIDVAPTVLELAALPPQPRFEGHSLVPLLHDDVPAGRPHDGPDIVLELEPTGATVDRRRHTAGMLRRMTKHLINQVRGTAEIYDLAANPGEIGPPPTADDPRAASVQQALETFRASLRTGRVSGEQRELDAATKEKLRALGYQF